MTNKKIIILIIITAIVSGTVSTLFYSNRYKLYKLLNIIETEDRVEENLMEWFGGPPPLKSVYSFCYEDVYDDVLGAMNAAIFFEPNDEMKPYFNVWRELMKKKNDIDDAYLDTHVIPYRMTELGGIETKTRGFKVFFYLKYWGFYINSRNFENKIIIKTKENPNILSPEEVFELESAKIENYEQLISDRDPVFISNMTNIKNLRISGLVPPSVMSCRNAVDLLRSCHHIEPDEVKLYGKKGKYEHEYESLKLIGDSVTYYDEKLDECVSIRASVDLISKELSCEVDSYKGKCAIF